MVHSLLWVLQDLYHHRSTLTPPTLNPKPETLKKKLKPRPYPPPGLNQTLSREPQQVP